MDSCSLRLNANRPSLATCGVRPLKPRATPIGRGLATCLAAFAALCAAAPANASAALSNLAGTVHSGSVITTDNVPTAHSDDASWTATPVPLSVATSFAVTTANGAVSNTSSSAAAWSASGLSGTVNLSDSWDFAVAQGQFNDIFDHGAWTYTFTPSTDVTFTLASDVQGAGTFQFGLQGYNFGYDDNATNLASGNFLFDPGGSGVFATNFSGGISHTVTLYTNANVTVFPDRDRPGTEVGQFGFVITGAGDAAAVPEPATWALMVLGFGGLGAALRRRRGLVALTA